MIHDVIVHNVVVKVRMHTSYPYHCADPGTSLDSFQSANQVNSLVSCSLVHKAAARLPRAHAQDRILDL